MKKIFTLAALAAICFASCSKNEVIVPQTEANEISFASYVGKAPVTKANDISSATDTDLTDNGFVVSAYHTGAQTWENYTGKTTAPNFMLFEKVSYNTGWSYVNAKYWPANETDLITFVAYAPATITESVPTVWGEGDDAGKVKFAVDGATDLIWGIKEDCNKNVTPGNETNDCADGIVDLQLDHKLCRLKISAYKASNYPHTIKVTKVELGNVFATECSLTVADGSITTNEESTKKGYTLTAETELTGTALTTTETLQSREGVDGANSTMLILAPQIVTIPVTVTYTTQDSLEGAPEVTNEKTANVDITMVSGYEYDLVLKVSLDKIEFTVVDTGAWESGEAQPEKWDTTL